MYFRGRSYNHFPLMVGGLLLLWIFTSLQVFGQNQESFQSDTITPIHSTLPNEKLNFEDDSQESCCSQDYTPAGKPIKSANTSASVSPNLHTAQIRQAEFEKSNPHYVENSTPAYLTTCERFTDLPENVANISVSPFSAANPNRNLAIVSYSTNVSTRLNANYFTDPHSTNTSDFHIQTAGGSGLVSLQDVNSYSVCMARGNNVAMVTNTDQGSILTYNGDDKVYLTGNNTNMFTRTGAGSDLIEIHLTRPLNQTPTGQTWQAFNIYKTAISGGSDEDTLVIRNAPLGTKWCHIGSYKSYGEEFQVVEIALPSTVTEGPRRQRISIGNSIEYVMIKGKKYFLQDFLSHGSPIDTVAQSIPLNAPLPRN